MVAPIIAGILATLAKNGLEAVAEVVKQKGKDFVEEKLGVELKPEMSEEEILKVKEAAMKHEEFLIQQDNSNTASARDMNSRIQETDKASWLAKNTAFVLDFCIVLSAIVLTFMAFFVVQVV